ncbi:MAG: preprotein translocase subunit SecE [Bacteroidetes bacterium]|nr:preprotein translocase subunit SecE [Bacteroidota bacterium]
MIRVRILVPVLIKAQCLEECWPTWEELRESTWIVLVASLLFALVIWALDSVLGVSLTQFYKLFK